MNHNHERKTFNTSSFVYSKPFIVFVTIGASIIFFLVTDYRNKFIEILPYLLPLACLGMHLFMHGGHAHTNKTSGDDSSTENKT